jgi:hypothetical protein
MAQAAELFAARVGHIVFFPSPPRGYGGTAAGSAADQQQQQQQLQVSSVTTKDTNGEGLSLVVTTAISVRFESERWARDVT